MVTFLPKMVLKIFKSLAKIRFTINADRNKVKDLIRAAFDFEVNNIYSLFLRRKHRYSFIICKIID